MTRNHRAPVFGGEVHLSCREHAILSYEIAGVLFFDRPGRREAAGGHGTRRQQSRRRIACQRLCLRPPRPAPCPPLPQHGIGRVVELGSFGFSKARLGKVTLVEWLFCDVAESRAKKACSVRASTTKNDATSNPQLLSLISHLGTVHHSPLYQIGSPQTSLP